MPEFLPEGASEVISRIRSGSLQICDNCGGQGYTDGGTSACGECHGAGVMTDELTIALNGEPDHYISGLSLPEGPSETVGKVISLERYAQLEAYEAAVVSSTLIDEREVLQAAIEWRRARIAACAEPIGNSSVWIELGSAETSLSEAVRNVLARL